jgi:glycosyltransferase involved in cell wall biosynthesis
MLANKKVTVVLPAYNAAQTLKQTFDEIPHDIVDDVILTDDVSQDATVEMARSLGIATIRHDRNQGYGSNQKTCYTAALARGADIAVMLHPDYQYTPKLVAAMASMIASEEFDVVLGSRILGRGALVGGMPIRDVPRNIKDIDWTLTLSHGCAHRQDSVFVGVFAVAQNADLPPSSVSATLGAAARSAAVRPKAD